MVASLPRKIKTLRRAVKCDKDHGYGKKVWIYDDVKVREFGCTHALPETAVVAD